MNRFGKFLELSVPTLDIQASLGFYRDLGFTELPTGDVRTYFYAVVTDGHIAIGLHGSLLEQPALSFVQSDVAARVRELEAAGVEMLVRRLGIEEFNEAGFCDPDENFVMLLEAPTFSTVTGNDVDVPVIGHAVGIRVASRRPEETSQFWESYGFALDETGDEDLLRLLAPGLVLEFDRRARGAMPVLHFRGADRDALLAGLERGGIEPKQDADGLILTAPEGTQLLVFLD
ncbi:MAG: hypothetical protein QNJ73_01900 [Gammaproteobacteria bacterium]|nr:hypothetical protein [Gammaproteobacteria bacterium]